MSALWVGATNIVKTFLEVTGVLASPDIDWLPIREHAKVCINFIYCFLQDVSKVCILSDQFNLSLILFARYQ